MTINSESSDPYTCFFTVDSCTRTYFSNSLISSHGSFFRNLSCYKDPLFPLGSFLYFFLVGLTTGGAVLFSCETVPLYSLRDLFTHFCLCYFRAYSESLYSTVTVQISTQSYFLVDKLNLHSLLNPSFCNFHV